MPRAERPLDPGDSPLLRLAAELRQLRKQAGNPVYRELSRRAHYSVTVLADAAGGRKLPSLAVTLAYVRACDGDVTEWTQRWHEVAGASNDGRLGIEEGQPPYVGLSAFDADDADRFFGREQLTEELCARVAQQRFVAVVGASGSGKSSLLRAGLLHRARTRGLRGIAGGPTVLMTPGPRPLEECATHIASLVNGAATDTDSIVRVQPNCLHLAALQMLLDQPPENDLIVVVDQFEELFTLCHDPAERAQFLRVLHTAVATPNSRTRVVLGVRADFYAHCTQYPTLAQALRVGQVLVEPLTTEQLRSAIIQPAIRTGCRVENALVSQVIADSTGQPGVLPLVSHTLLETWRRRHGTTLTLTGYQAAGGIAQAIARTAETAYTALTKDQQQRARQLFLRLVALGEGTEDTKRRLSRAELDLEHPDAAAALEQLARSRLVTVDRDSVQITHEALIRNWPRLAGWLTADRDGLRVHRQLTEATTVWESLDRDAGALYRGTRLAIASDWATDSAASLTPREQVFLDASRTAEVAEYRAVRRRTRRTRQLVALLAAVVLLAGAAAVHAVRAQSAATQQRNIALAQRVVSQLPSVYPETRSLAAQLGLVAYRLTPPTPETRRGLLSLFGHRGSGAVSVDARSGSWLELSHDRRTMAVAVLFARVGTDPGSLRNIADPRHPERLASVGASELRNIRVAFSADRRTLAIVAHNGTTELWSVDDCRRPEQRAVFASGSVSSLAFSPDGHTLAIASGTDTGIDQQWDTDAERVVARLCDQASETITRDQWDRYLPGVDYQPPCPAR